MKAHLGLMLDNNFTMKKKTTNHMYDCFLNISSHITGFAKEELESLKEAESLYDLFLKNNVYTYNVETFGKIVIHEISISKYELGLYNIYFKNQKNCNSKKSLLNQIKEAGVTKCYFEAHEQIFKDLVKLWKERKINIDLN